MKGNNVVLEDHWDRAISEQAQEVQIFIYLGSN